MAWLLLLTQQAKITS